MPTSPRNCYPNPQDVLLHSLRRRDLLFFQVRF